ERRVSELVAEHTQGDVLHPRADVGGERPRPHEAEAAVSQRGPGRPGPVRDIATEDGVLGLLELCFSFFFRQVRVLRRRPARVRRVSQTWWTPMAAPITISTSPTLNTLCTGHDLGTANSSPIQGSLGCLSAWEFSKWAYCRSNPARLSACAFAGITPPLALMARKLSMAPRARIGRPGTRQLAMRKTLMMTYDPMWNVTSRACDRWKIEMTRICTASATTSSPIHRNRSVPSLRRSPPVATTDSNTMAKATTKITAERPGRHATAA